LSSRAGDMLRDSRSPNGVLVR